MPPVFRELARRAAGEGGFDGFSPDACLINRYEPGARMSLHQDRDENDFGAPIVSVSLGLPAIFLFGGPKRSDKPQRLSAGAWRHRGMGRAVAAVLPRRRAARRRRTRRDGPPANQSDVSQGALRLLPSPLVGEGGAKRRMRGLYPRISVSRRQTPHRSRTRFARPMPRSPTRGEGKKRSSHRSVGRSMLSWPGARHDHHRNSGRHQRRRQPHRRLSRRAATGVHAGLDHLCDLSAEARAPRSGSRRRPSF